MLALMYMPGTIDDMVDTNNERRWPPAHLAVLQNGDGYDAYYRPIEGGEDPMEFVERIAKIAVRGVEQPIGTTFREVIDGTTGEADPELTMLVVEAMEAQRVERRALKQAYADHDAAMREHLKADHWLGEGQASPL